MRYNTTKRDPIKNSFIMPNEIFRLGLSEGAIAVYLASCVVQVFCNASRIIEERTARQHVHNTGVDSKLKREIEQKKRGVSMRM